MSEPASALSRLFAAERREGDAVWFSLPGGAVLFDSGEAADQLYLLHAGRLGVFRREAGGEPAFAGIVRPGEPVGEQALLAGTQHTARVVALRDSEIFALPRSEFFKAAERDPAVTTEIARLTIARSRRPLAGAGSAGPSVFGFVATSEAVKVRPLAEAVAKAVSGAGYTCEVLGVETQPAPTEWFSQVEREHDFVLYAGEADEPGWRRIVGRQSDRLFRVGSGGASPPAQDSDECLALQAHRLVDLILVHGPEVRAPSGSAAWLEALAPARLFHIREGDQADIQRLARLITNRAVGVVFSGGGARAYAHVGAIKALREAGEPIDFLGGASMGAIIAAGVAKGWDDAELEARVRKAFVDTSPLDDVALPLLAMTQGLKVAQRLEEHFGDTDIADLWRPFFCVSSNLTSGTYQIHQKGSLREALRASISLPGVMPPATDGANVLVDGAVMKNFPADLMRAVQTGPILGVDVTRGRSITAAEVARPSSVWKWIWSGEWRKGPPIVSLLMRAATVSSGRDLAASREATDVLVLPDLAGVEIRDWKAFEPAVEAGYRATKAALEALDRPLTDLRRRPHMADLFVSPG